MVQTAGMAYYRALDIPMLRVGTLDALMALSDELGKSDTAVEVVVRKIQKAFMDLKNNEQLLVDNGAETYWSQRLP